MKNLWLVLIFSFTSMITLTSQYVGDNNTNGVGLIDCKSPDVSISLEQADQYQTLVSELSLAPYQQEVLSVGADADPVVIVTKYKPQTKEAMTNWWAAYYQKYREYLREIEKNNKKVHDLNEKSQDLNGFIIPSPPVAVANTLSSVVTEIQTVDERGRIELYHSWLSHADPDYNILMIMRAELYNLWLQSLKRWDVWHYYS